MHSFPPRHPISRARFFLRLSDDSRFDERERFEAFLDASIIFARAALHHLKFDFERHPDWKKWWGDLADDPAVEFFREKRNFILKQAPLKVGQVISPGKIIKLARDFYYFERPGIPATVTVREHLERLETIVLNAETRFGGVGNETAGGANLPGEHGKLEG